MQLATCGYVKGRLEQALSSSPIKTHLASKPIRAHFVF